MKCVRSVKIMKNFHIAIILATIMVLVVFSGAYAATQDNNSGKTIYVAKNGTDRNDGLTPEKPKRNLESAIEVTDNGDTIRVGSGAYSTVYLDKNITLIGEGAEATFIDGNMKRGCIRIAKGVNVSVRGFTIKNGNQDCGIGYIIYGGGIDNRGTLSVEDSIITSNIAREGGGIRNIGLLTLKNTTIIKNRAVDNGGGIWNNGTIISSNVSIGDNQAHNTNGTCISSGGGVYMGTHGEITMKDSVILNNIADFSGGIYSYSLVTLQRVLIKSNVALKKSGGLDNEWTMIIEDSAIIDNIVLNGTAGGIYNCGGLRLYGSSVINNQATDGGGIINKGEAYIDQLTYITGNKPNDFIGTPFIPA
jgi:hypothetical protein